MSIICLLLQLYVIVVFARVILSWFPVTNGGVVENIAAVLYALTEPVLGPMRRVMPPVRMGAMALDLSPLVLLLGISFLRVAIGC